MKKMITGPWHLPRLLQLILGIAILVQGIEKGEMIFLLGGGLVSLMAIANFGCCGAGTCRINHADKIEEKLNQKNL